MHLHHSSFHNRRDVVEPLPAPIREILKKKEELTGEERCALNSHAIKLQRFFESQEDNANAMVVDACADLITPIMKGQPLTEQIALRSVYRLMRFLDQAMFGKPASEMATLQSGLGNLLKVVRDRTETESGVGDAVDPDALPLVNHTRLGEVLLSLAVIGSRDLETALRVQRVTGKRIGQTLLEMGVVDSSELNRALQYQSTKPQTPKPVPMTGGDRRPPVGAAGGGLQHGGPKGAEGNANNQPANGMQPIRLDVKKENLPKIQKNEFQRGTPPKDDN